ncbi:hypothetical protein [Streptomyces phaeochromogenes]|uniref:hypothetical protein n=1 Tax=Streptomyces phaeochromogenes TaxID=1923 RepID=UPI002DDA29B6|nr:hypothetical protein [Streptomyces phaeochromogenes]WRZ34690.1 hypothetical protein OG931_46630 [Streptomyces phaeochromogenes]
MSQLTYAGQTFNFRVGDGVVFRNTYAADGTTLRYGTLEGPAGGAEETAPSTPEPSDPPEGP